MIHIRQAGMEDIDALVRLRVALQRELGFIETDGQEGDLAGATRRYLRDALPAEEFKAWLAEAGGQIVGTGALVLFRHPPSARNLTGIEGYIMNMYTMREWRGRGIASRILDTIIACARETQAGRLWLYAAPDGQHLYEKAGFVYKHRRMPEMELLLPRNTTRQS